MNETTTNTAPAGGTAAAPAAGGTAAASSPEHAAFNDAPRELNDVADIAAALDGGAAPGDAAPDEASVDSAGEDKADAASQAQDAAQGNEWDNAPLPEGWDAEAWKGLSPQLRAKVSGQIQEHARALAAEKAAQQALIQQNENFAAASNAQMQQSLMMMRQVMEGEFAAVNWEQLANEDPARYVQLQRAYQTRMGAIQDLQGRIAQQMAIIQQRRAQEYDKATEAEYQRILPEVKALLGQRYNPKTFAQDTAAYLRSQGVPDAAINAMSQGYELKMVVKSMLFDKMQAARASAAKKLAEAPRVSSPASAPDSEDGAKLRSARARLNSAPNSTEALAAVLEVM